MAIYGENQKAAQHVPTPCVCAARMLSCIFLVHLITCASPTSLVMRTLYGRYRLFIVVLLSVAFELFGRARAAQQNMQGMLWERMGVW